MARYKKYKMSSSPPHLTTCGLDFWYCKLIYNNCGLDFWYCKLIFKNWRKRVVMDHYGIFNTVQTDHQYQYLQCNIKWNKISMDQIFLSCFLLQRTSTSLFPVLLGRLGWWWRLSLSQYIHFSGKVVSISFDYFSQFFFCVFLFTDHGGRPNRDWWVETSYGLHSWWRLHDRFQHLLNLIATFICTAKYLMYIDKGIFSLLLMTDFLQFPTSC